MAAKIRPVRVTRGDTDAVRDLRVHFLRLAPSCDFETSSRALKKATLTPLYKLIQKLAQFRKYLGKEWLQQKQVRLTEYGCKVLIDCDYTAYLKKNTASLLYEGVKPC